MNTGNAEAALARELEYCALPRSRFQHAMRTLALSPVVQSKSQAQINLLPTQTPWDQAPYEA